MVTTVSNQGLAVSNGKGVAPGLPSKLSIRWLRRISSTSAGVPIYEERPKSRAPAMKELSKLLCDHFVGEDTIMKMGGYPKAANTIRNSMPISKRTQSGDLGELIATEYVDSQTPFKVPIRKFRWKSDRKMPMHGNHIIAILQLKNGTVKVLKGESKSAQLLSNATVKSAARALDDHNGRPNPSTLAFIAKRLYEAGRDSEGKIFASPGVLLAGDRSMRPL